LKGVVFKPPERHPKIGLPAIRAFYHIDRIDLPTAARLAKHIITGYFRDNLDIDDPYAIAQVASVVGMDRDSVLPGINDPEVKAIARQHGEAAVARGVFGSPWIFVDGEPFWGSDRLAMIERWLSTGPW
jgi:2-hydroxychromene-2-carboxylate isomerase